MNSKNSITALAIILVCSSGLSAEALAEDRVKSGKISCGVAPVMRGGGIELHDDTIGLRNINDEETVTIERLQAWDGNGNMLWDSTTDGFPANPGFNSVIVPHASSRFLASDVLGILPVNSHLGQVAIEYSLDKKGFRLGAVASHSVRDIGPTGMELSRQVRRCRDL